MIKYLIIINIAAFILYFINHLLYKYTDKSIDKLITVLCFLFGSFGIFVAYLIFDRDFEKPVLMSRVFLFSILIIQMIVLIFIFDLRSCFYILKGFKNYYFLYYIVGINLLTFIFLGIDKYQAIYKKKRISNATLLLLSFIGGSIGAILAMKIFRHKTQKDYYSVGLKYIIAMQICIVVFILML